MKLPFGILLLCSVAACGRLTAATDVRVDFTLQTTDAYGAPLGEQRYYYLYRPDNLPRTTPVPMVLVMAASEPSAPATFFHHVADAAGFLVVSCAFGGNSVGGSWNNDDPRITGFEDYDYISAVISAVRSAENGGDAFICGLSKGGHTSYAFACERPREIKAACSVDEFMGLTSNIPLTPVPIMALHGTADTNVPYTMAKDSVDAWRAMDGLMAATPITTVESSPLLPGQVTQTTWRGGIGGAQVAFVTIVGGDHRWPVSTVQTGYDAPAAVWTFFSQFVTPAQSAPKVVAQPVANVQLAGNPASFWVSAIGQAPLRYQWQRNGVAIAGATNAWLTLPAISAADDGAIFRAVVTNATGSVTSSGAALSVKPAPAGITFSTPPADQSVVAGTPATFTVQTAATGTVRYQWQKNGVDVPGATGATYTLPRALTSDSGATFTATLTTGTGTITSSPATLSVLPAPAAPIVLTNPERSRVLVGDSGIFAVSTWSALPVTYQWQKGGFLTGMSDIAGATSATYSTPPTTTADQHTLFRCVVSNAAGAAVSASEMLFVTATPTAPGGITSAIQAYAAPGAAFNYRITVSSGTPPLRYAATGLPAGLVVDAASGGIVGAVSQPGDYPVTITCSNSAGSTSATLTVHIADTPIAWGADHVANLAARGIAGNGANRLIAGFILSGSGPKRVLIRAIGPGLAKFGVAGTLPDPRLTLLDAGGHPLAANDDWDSTAATESVAQSVGAFPLDRGSKDAVSIVTLTPGNYTAIIDAAADVPRGVALVEVYDVDLSAGGSHLANISTRGVAGTDANTLIAGFVVAGDAPKPVLIRAVGAATLAQFGVDGGLGDARLELCDASGQTIAFNDDWGRSRSAPYLPQAFSSAGAFGLSDTSKDAAILATLSPGSYTAKVVNRDQNEGVALVEVYQASSPP